MNRSTVAFTSVFFMAMAGTVLSTGCTSTPTQASFGETVDDSVITSKIKAAFVEDKTVSALHISVETFKGTVQLSGFANSQTEIERAVALAAQVKGVKSVRNDIHLKSQS